MIDIWFKKDLKSIYDTHQVAVFIDESKDAEFLLNSIEDEYITYKANNEVEELHVKYLIEKEQPSKKKFLIYTNSRKENLKFIREYCEIYGCLEIRYLQNYIKENVHKVLNLNINLKDEELMAAAKVSIGKDRTYWMDLCHIGSTEIFDMQKELLPFLHDPKEFEKNKYDPQLREIFYRKINELLGVEYIAKPAATLANEVVKAMLDGLANHNCDKILLEVYLHWLDSVNYRESFTAYLQNYTLPKGLDIWKLNQDHPFLAVDEAWLTEIGTELGNREKFSTYLQHITRRSKSRASLAMGIYFWDDVKILLEFDSKDIAYLGSFQECVQFYTKHLYKLDSAIRDLYTQFLHQEKIIEPYQELYKEIISIFLDKWYKYFSEYKEQQTGILQRIISGNSSKTAVIVGDGISYELAVLISQKVKNGFKCTKDYVLADLPSETENNMSRIYLDNGILEKVHNKRERYLQEQNPELSMEFIKLDEVNGESRAAKYLICTYKDIDSMGEKLQHNALKFFPQAVDYFASKIALLLNNGYAKVYLISDHGFVLTGLFSESDKISVTLDGPFDKAERYLRTEQRQPSLSEGFVELEKSYEDKNYLYLSHTNNPLKTTGVYGFSHGGASPQELVTPYFCWEHSADSAASLKVKISNKSDLANVTGDLFQVKVEAGNMEDIFSLSRRVYLQFYSGKTKINQSDIFTIEERQIVKKDYSFEGNSSIDVLLLDADTIEELDRVTVKQNSVRDLGGLF